MLLKHINYNVKYEKLISKQIVHYIYNTIFAELKDIMKDRTVYNSTETLADKIKTGDIFYKDGYFYSSSGRFTSRIAHELERMEFTYSKQQNAYRQSSSVLPVDIQWAVDTAHSSTQEKAIAMSLGLMIALRNIKSSDYLVDFDNNVYKIMSDLQNKFYRNADRQKFKLLGEKLTSFDKLEISKRYTNNLNFWIKDWTEQEIVKLRTKIEQMSADGAGIQEIESYIDKEFAVGQRKAEFLARNETTILQSSYATYMLAKEGFTHFKWVSKQDNRVRPLHRELNGHIFAFDDPPIIDERTGLKGLPGQTYNCRCHMDGFANKSFFDNRKEIYKANNSFGGKIKKWLKIKT